MADAGGGGSGAVGAPLEVDTGDILRLIMQFLREQGLVRSLAALQDEADVSFNVVDDLPAFTADVLAGRWDVLLPRVAAMALPPPVLMLLYEQVVRELCEAREGDVARALLRGAMPLLMLQQEEPGRYARLEHLAAAVAAGRGWDAGEAYPDGRGKDARRADVARAIGEHLVSVPPSRLAVLLSHALQWQRHTGALPAPAPQGGGAAPAPARWDVFRGLAPAPPSARHDVEDRPPSKPAGVIRGGAIPQCAVFTPDGASLVVGSDDGILEVYDAGSGKLRTDLAFQAADEFMMHDTVRGGWGCRAGYLRVLCACECRLCYVHNPHFYPPPPRLASAPPSQAVTCVAVSRDGGLLASGSKDGKIKVWRLATGECLRRFPTAHPDGGVGALAFSADTTLSSATAAADAATAAAGAAAGSLLLSGGLDGVAR
jgi:WD40 repeat-containing protein SMU1